MLDQNFNRSGTPVTERNSAALVCPVIQLNDVFISFYFAAYTDLFVIQSYLYFTTDNLTNIVTFIQYNEKS